MDKQQVGENGNIYRRQQLLSTERALTNQKEEEIFLKSDIKMGKGYDQTSHRKINERVRQIRRSSLLIIKGMRV